MNDLQDHIQWTGNAASGFLLLLDQTKLPNEEVFLQCRDVESIWHAIKRLSVRGAPAIGIAAAYACVTAVQATGSDDPATNAAALRKAAAYLATSRPTAVNLFWALDKMQNVQPVTAESMLTHARAIHDRDRQMCRLIGEYGHTILEKLLAKKIQTASADASVGVLTHCNAGALATGGIGTATAPMYVAHERGTSIKVYADETRPLLQGARLTAFELGQGGVDVTLICDDMAAQVMREGRIDIVITGADRIAGNGDAANKIGTYNLAVLAKHHAIPFYIAAPSSTFDLSLESGDLIPIEQRGSEEITEGFGKRTAPMGVKTYSPAFDVTPRELITGIITERGVITPVNTEQVLAVISDS